MLHAERMYALINAPPASSSPMTPGSSHNPLATHSRSASQTSVVTAPVRSPASIWCAGAILRSVGKKLTRGNGGRNAGSFGIG